MYSRIRKVGFAESCKARGFGILGPFTVLARSLSPLASAAKKFGGGWELYFRKTRLPLVNCRVEVWLMHPPPVGVEVFKNRSDYEGS